MLPDAPPQLGDGFLDERLHLPLPLATADLVEEVAEDAAAVGGVADLGVELQAVHRTLAVLDGRGVARFGGGQWDEAAADRLHLVAVAHPNGGLLGDAREQRLARLDAADGPAELAAGRRQDLAAHRLAGELHAVTDAQDRDAQVEDRGVTVGRARLVDAGGTAGEDQAAGVQLADALGRQVVAHQLAENVQVADSAADELAVLRPEVEDQYLFTFGKVGHTAFPSNQGWCSVRRPSSSARRVAASTASIRAARKPPRSRACRPAMVVPPGLATMSLRTAG